MMWAGLIVAALLLCLGLGAMLVLGFSGAGCATGSAIGSGGVGAGGFLGGHVDLARTLYALKSAGMQAVLSVIGSLMIAIPAAIAVARRPNWPFMSIFVVVISLAMVLPTTVAAMGMLSVWGRQGVMLALCSALAGDACHGFNIYGLHGVVMAHMMLNIPLMMRVFIPMLQAIPERRFQLSALLALGVWGRFRHVEYPQIKPAIPGVMALVFLLCFTSFALVLMLGGGPKVTTLEVEIYSAVRFEFNLAAAAGLSVIQFGCAAVVVAVLASHGQFSRPAPLSTHSADSLIMRRDLGMAERMMDMAVLTVMAVLVALPMVMVAVRGIGPDVITLLKRPQFWDALGASLTVASLSAMIVLVLALMMAHARAMLTVAGAALPTKLLSTTGRRICVMILDGGIMLYLVIPSVVLGTAAFIMLRGTGDVFGYGIAVVILANVLLSLSFAVKLLDRRMSAIKARHDRLSMLFGIAGWQRLRVLTLPPLKKDLGLAVGLTAALSIGDLGVIALFAQPDFQTLPWLLYQLAGRYAAGEAAGLALMLMVLTVMMFLAARMMVHGVINLLSGHNNGGQDA